MTNLFDKLYPQFLSGIMNIKDFQKFKQSLNKTSDIVFSKEMENYWEKHDNYPKMDTKKKQLIRENILKQIPNHKKQISPIWYRTAVAAVITVILSLSVWNILISDKETNTTPFLAEVPAGNKVKLTLPDKSIVNLNSESFLSYTFQEGKRITELTGEAYFQVEKDKNHPFIIQVGNLNIEVLGTSFNVCSYPDEDIIETTLIEGSIRLYDSEKPAESFILKPDQKAIYSKNNRNIHFVNTDNKKETAWTRNHFVFESEKLSTVLLRIERWYGVKIELLCPEIGNDRISGSFKNEQLPYIMEALKIQYGFQYEITGKNIIIKKSGNQRTQKPMK